MLTPPTKNEQIAIPDGIVPSSHWSDLDSSSHNSSASVKHNWSCHIFRQVGHLLKPTSTGNTQRNSTNQKSLWFKNDKWLNHPFEKYARQNRFVFSKVRGENKQYLKPPPSNVHTNIVVLLSFLVFARYLYLWAVSCWSPCEAALRPNRPSETNVNFPR